MGDVKTKDKRRGKTDLDENPPKCRRRAGPAIEVGSSPPSSEQTSHTPPPPPEKGAEKSGEETP